MSTDRSFGVVPEFTLGDRLRKARALTGLSTRQFADEIGVSQKTITDAEGDRRQQRRILIRAYAMRSGVSLEWLEGGNNPAPTSQHARTGVYDRTPSHLVLVAA